MNANATTGDTTQDTTQAMTRRCPRCRATYPDEYQFCTTDGSPLASLAVRAGTKAMGRPSVLSGASGLSGALARDPRSRAAILLMALAVPALLWWLAHQPSPPPPDAATGTGAERRPVLSSSVRSSSVRSSSVRPSTAPRSAGGALPKAPSVVAAAERADWKVQPSEVLDCHLEVPQGWIGGEEAAHTRAARIRFVAPEDARVSVLVALDPDRHGQAPLAVWRDMDARLTRAYKERYAVIELCAARFSSYPNGALWHFRLQRQGEPVKEKLDYTVTRADGNGVAVLFTAPPERFAAYRPLFEAMASRIGWGQH